MAGNNSAARKRLFRINPHCFWCGKLTVFTIEIGKLKHDAATVDHLFSRLHPDRKAARRGRGRLVNACNQCNKDRSNAETRGLMFVPKLESRKVIAELSTITPLGAPTYKGSGSQLRQVVQNPPKVVPLTDFGWLDNNGDLRPRSWEEYVAYRSAFIGEAFERRIKPKPKRIGFCTIGELLQHRQTVSI